MTMQPDTSEFLLQLASSKTIGGEAAFVFPDVLEAIDVCTRRQIAVLGVELFRFVPEGYTTESMSPYEFGLSTRTWLQFVEINNHEAARFITGHRGGDDHFYVLTTSSRRELEAVGGG